MREPKTVYYGVPAYEWQPSEISTPDLLREMTTLARINYFLWDPREDPVATKMRDHYGALWGNGELAPLVVESRTRAAGGDAECQTFWSTFDKDPIVVESRSYAIGDNQHEKDTNTLINQIHDLTRKYPEIRRHYGRVDLENLDIRMERPGVRSNGQLSTLEAVA